MAAPKFRMAILLSNQSSRTMQSFTGRVRTALRWASTTLRPGLLLAFKLLGRPSSEVLRATETDFEICWRKTLLTRAAALADITSQRSAQLEEEVRLRMLEFGLAPYAPAALLNCKLGLNAYSTSAFVSRLIDCKHRSGVRSQRRCLVTNLLIRIANVVYRTALDQKHIPLVHAHKIVSHTHRSGFRQSSVLLLQKSPSSTT